MIALRDQEYCIPGLPKDLCIISQQVIHTPEGYTVTLLARCHDEHDSYVELNFKE